MNKLMDKWISEYGLVGTIAGILYEDFLKEQHL